MIMEAVERKHSEAAREDIETMVALQVLDRDAGKVMLQVSGRGGLWESVCVCVRERERKRGGGEGKHIKNAAVGSRPGIHSN